MKVIIVKEVMTCDVSPVVMFENPSYLQISISMLCKNMYTKNSRNTTDFSRNPQTTKHIDSFNVKPSRRSDAYFVVYKLPKQTLKENVHLEHCAAWTSDRRLPFHL